MVQLRIVGGALEGGADFADHDVAGGQAGALGGGAGLDRRHEGGALLEAEAGAHGGGDRLEGDAQPGGLQRIGE